MATSFPRFIPSGGSPKCSSLNRPSTAPSKDNVAVSSVTSRSSWRLSDDAPYSRYPIHASFHDTVSHVQIANKLESETSLVGALPYPDNRDSSNEAKSPLTTMHADYDWATFISAYADGQWDPNRTPTPPRPCQASTSSFALASDVPDSTLMINDCDRHLLSRSPDGFPTQCDSCPPSPDVSPIPVPAPARSSTSTLSISPSNSLRRFRPAAPSQLPMPPHRMRSSFSTSSAPLPSPPEAVISTPATLHINPEAQTTAATLRWAAARVDISPLALPSPEHELTDPMRGSTATVPMAAEAGYHQFSSSNGARKPRLKSFWHGTTDVEVATSHETLLPLSQSDSSPELGSQLQTPPQQDQPVPFPSVLFETPEIVTAASASAPISRTRTLHDFDQPPYNDYFGASRNSDANTNDNKPNGVIRPPLPPKQSSGALTSMSTPALPRRVCLTRQTSSPLPDASPREAQIPGSWVATETVSSIRTNRAAKEEQMFNDLGYLAPPNPPDELERRRALYKFNIWNTGPDLNFDRIAHLAKLVFSTKGVIISLVDGNEQWMKSVWGIQRIACSRAHSICAHAILQRGDEPMVVLDTHKDWRFSKNPVVIGAPHIRFYAGAPLRTAEGYNIGALAVISDTPRDDFSPRQRHTLKEFAAIAMREMELWRDKIQLRIRDRIQNSMEQFSRECLEIDTEQMKSDRPSGPPGLIVGSPMDRVYDRAAKLVKRTLDLEGVIVMDVSHCEVLESMSTEGTVSVNMHFGDPSLPATKRQLSSEEYQQFNAFFAKYPDGKISEGIVPPCFKPFLPTHIQYALTVPIFNIDKRPFALLCAYNGNNQMKRYLEGHELSYLRAIGVIILSAVLKRRMILADKAKSLFISNISHELRTPLHGILAAAELLSESHLNHSQLSFLQTVQACGTSLVETVNHVLDFTKLSGNSKAGGVENVIDLSKVDLMQLVEEAVDGSWIGYRARSVAVGDSAIGSVYSPPKDAGGTPLPRSSAFVETVVDIGYRRQGWNVKCEKGGIRRILMNLFGNSLKFTSHGYVHVVLRELPLTDTDPPDKVKVELSVLDTGKGISQNFLQNQLFHPFSQENPLQTGTGLGLAIVNSIATSENVGGKVDVWSEEGTGTEIKVTFFAERVEEPRTSPEMEPFKLEDRLTLPSISLVGFDSPHEGIQLLKRVLENVLKSWWGFKVHSGIEHGDIVIVNEDISPVVSATRNRDSSRPFIIVTSSRGSATIMGAAADHELIGGFCRTLFKPYGPRRLRTLVKLCLHVYTMRLAKTIDAQHAATPSPPPLENRSQNLSGSSLPRRKSEESHRTWPRKVYPRPSIGVRSSSSLTISPTMQDHISTLEQDGTVASGTTISMGSGGSLLKSSLRLPGSLKHQFRVLVVEDNSILRNLLIRWLTQKGYDFCAAVDGRDGVDTFEKQGPFDVVLLDLSMPNLDGIAATAEIRGIESRRSSERNATLIREPHSARIVALTGMSSLEDKRRAFEAGVDGYLVKPVAFRTLDEMFHKMGIS